MTPPAGAGQRDPSAAAELQQGERRAHRGDGLRGIGPRVVRGRPRAVRSVRGLLRGRAGGRCVARRCTRRWLGVEAGRGRRLVRRRGRHGLAAGLGGGGRRGAWLGRLVHARRAGCGALVGGRSRGAARRCGVGDRVRDLSRGRVAQRIGRTDLEAEAADHARVERRAVVDRPPAQRDGVAPLRVRAGIASHDRLAARVAGAVSRRDDRDRRRCPVARHDGQRDDPVGRQREPDAGGWVVVGIAGVAERDLAAEQPQARGDRR